eukprot:CAMPEP_0171853810 /NCGR_PEP_ID=MMETSP0992-20121227/22490_1 /TAXON_ID=483369 /ORGANISM="non described non described, Strain CCMP2098" /LENGTH=414 /DNA_ID=CAMNT_0012474275 /DNA_START=35 /DNA_END=1275 /DNA_ORIENTATION=+
MSSLSSIAGGEEGLDAELNKSGEGAAERGGGGEECSGGGASAAASTVSSNLTDNEDTLVDKPTGRLPWLIKVSDLTTLLEGLSVKMGVPFRNDDPPGDSFGDQSCNPSEGDFMKSHHVQAYLKSHKVFLPLVGSYSGLFKRGIPDIAVTYSWSASLGGVEQLIRRGVAATAGLDGESTVWLDVLCVNQNAKDILAELSISEVVYREARRHFVLDTPVALKRTWCLYELLLRIEGRDGGGGAATMDSAFSNEDWRSINEASNRIHLGGDGSSGSQSSREPLCLDWPATGYGSSMTDENFSGNVGVVVHTDYFAGMEATFPADMDAIKAKVSERMSVGDFNRRIKAFCARGIARDLKIPSPRPYALKALELLDAMIGGEDVNPREVSTHGNLNWNIAGYSGPRGPTRRMEKPSSLL